MKYNGSLKEIIEIGRGESLIHITKRKIQDHNNECRRIPYILRKK
jgi:hypothetical protein